MPEQSIRLDAIRPETAGLFSLLANYPQLSRFTLIGGTALALIIGHRLSNDLDFAFYGDQLPTGQIDSLVSELKALGVPIQLITDANAISSFRIATGKRLLNYARDYIVGDTKLTFFAMGSKQTPIFVDYLKQARFLQLENVSFSILGLDGLKATKAVVIGQRTRSRDLYDLLVLARDHSYSVELILQDAQQYGTNDDPEYYKAVLRGDIPLDQDDEGLEAVGVQVSLDDIYAYFDERLSQLEIAEAERIARIDSPSAT
jgi:predicted nucleotidyltransferase component of viral defense system